jgi:hypothetical protein
MLHACSYTICLVFCYTSWHFYAFSRTNLLTRCHSASSLFFVIFVFRKVTQEIFSELDKTKAKPPIFTEASRRPKIRWRGARGWPRHRGVRPSPWPRPPMVSPPGPPPDDAPLPIKSPQWEKPEGRIAFPRNILQATAIVESRSGRSRSSSWHPTGEGNPCRRLSPPPWSPPE